MSSDICTDLQNDEPRHSAIYMADWWRGSLGEGAEVVASPSTLARRLSFRDADFIIGNDDVVATSMTLSEQYSSSYAIEGSRVNNKVEPRIGAIGIVVPGQATRVCLVGRARFLLLGFSVSGLKATIESDFELAGENIEFTNRFGQQDPALIRAMLRVATANSENAYQAVLSMVACLIYFHSLHADRREVGRSRSMTPLRLHRVLDLVEANLPQPISLLDMAQAAGISAFHFAREFQLATGCPPHQYVVRRRIDRAVQLLTQTRLPIETIAREVGFYRAAHMSRHMRRVFGLVTSELRDVF